MTDRNEFADRQSDRLYKLEGFDADEVAFLSRAEYAEEFAEHLEDILWDMESPSFDDEDWINEDFSILAVIGAGEDDWIVQPQAFLLHSRSSGAVHLLEMAPTDASTFEELPRVADSLEQLEDKLSL